MIRTAALALVLCCVAGCCEPHSDAMLVHTRVNGADELWGRVNDGESRRLLHGAQAYRPLLSPDGDWLAVEVRQMSDLTVVRLFRRDGETLVATDTDITARAWQWAVADTNITLGELSGPRTLVSGWDRDAQTLSLALSATISGSDQPFETVVSFPLEREP